MHTFDISLNNFSDSLIDALNGVLPKVPMLLFGLLLGVLTIRLAVRLIRIILKLTTMHTGLRYVLTSLLEGLMWILLLVWLLKAVGFQDILVFFTGSIAALGLAMAAGGSTLVADIIAGIFLAQDKDFNVGDEVIAGETPTRGFIVGMDARRIRLRDKDGTLHVIPNALVERKEWVVVNRRHELSSAAPAPKRSRIRKNS